MITFTLDILSIAFGCLIGTSISFLAFWIVETINYNDSKWSVGFNKGWDACMGMKKEFNKSKEFTNEQ